MPETKIYTVIICYDWSVNSEEIKKILTQNNFVLNLSKTTNLTNDELKNELEKFKISDKVAVENFTGISGLYENINIFIKIIKVKDTSILIYKGNEESFYKELLKHCGSIGCLILKIIDDEIVFQYIKNVELLSCLNNITNEKTIKIRNFNTKMELYKEQNILYSDDFKNKWIKCIENNVIS